MLYKMSKGEATILEITAKALFDNNANTTKEIALQQIVRLRQDLSKFSRDTKKGKEDKKQFLLGVVSKTNELYVAAGLEPRFTLKSKVGKSSAQDSYSTTEFRKLITTSRLHHKQLLQLAKRVYASEAGMVKIPETVCGDIAGSAVKVTKITRDDIKQLERLYSKELSKLSDAYSAGRKFRPQWYDRISQKPIEDRKVSSGFERAISVSQDLKNFFIEASNNFVLAQQAATSSGVRAPDTVPQGLNLPGEALPAFNLLVKDGVATSLSLTSLLGLYVQQNAASLNVVKTETYKADKTGPLVSETVPTGRYKADVLMKTRLGKIFDQLSSTKSYNNKGRQKDIFNPDGFKINHFQSIVSKSKTDVPVSPAKAGQAKEAAELLLTYVKQKSKERQADAGVVRIKKIKSKIRAQKKTAERKQQRESGVCVAGTQTPSAANLAALQQRQKAQS